MQDRMPQDFSYFRYGKRLYQEWIVDQWCKIEGYGFKRTRKLYVLMTAGDTNLQTLGTKIIIPSMHIGGPLFFQLLFQDGQVLMPGEVPNDRPVIISRVFWMKLNTVLKDLLKDGIYGKVIGRIHVIKFKREDYHMHIHSS